MSGCNGVGKKVRQTMLLIHATFDQVRLGQVRLGQVRLGQVQLGSDQLHSIFYSAYSLCTFIYFLPFQSWYNKCRKHKRVTVSRIKHTQRFMKSNKRYVQRQQRRRRRCQNASSIGTLLHYCRGQLTRNEYNHRKLFQYQISLLLSKQF